VRPARRSRRRTRFFTVSTFRSGLIPFWRATSKPSRSGSSAKARRVAAPRALLPPFSFQTKASTGSIWFKRFFADLTGDVIRAGSFTSVNELVRDIEAYLAERNANPKPYKWKAEGAEILSKRARAALDKAGAA
jgi:hypothetical protein